MNFLRENVRRLGLFIAAMFIVSTALLLFVTPYVDDPRGLGLIDDDYWLLFVSLCVGIALWQLWRWVLLAGLAAFLLWHIVPDWNTEQGVDWFSISLGVILATAGLLERKRAQRKKAADSAHVPGRE